MTTLLGTDKRAVSEIVGTVLLISIVLLGSVAVVMFGASAISDAQDRTKSEAATDYLQQVDSELATLSASADDPEVMFDPQDSAARDYDITREGHLNITVRGDSNACSYEQELPTIEYEDSNGNTIGYEAGGVWNAGINSSTPVSPPDVTFSNGMLDVHLVNVSGTFDQARNRVRLNESETTNTTERFSSELMQDDCARPNTVEVEVRSQFYQGWADYLESEIGTSPDDVDPSTETVRFTIDQDRLHPSVNDEENQVINLDGTTSYMNSSSTYTSNGQPPEIGIGKDANNTYNAYVGPVTNDTLDIGREVRIEGTNVTGPPLDVSLVMDQSGSMAFDEDGDDCGQTWDPDRGWVWVECSPSKTEIAQDAAKNFVGYINESRDRVSIQGYNASGIYHKIDGNYFSEDFTEVNATIDSLGQHGSTRIDNGLDHSNSVFDLKGNETRLKVTILLTDGENDACSSGQSTYDCVDNVRTLERAWEADNNSETIYTIGFGDVNDDLLDDVATATGGEYYPADDSDDLQNAFRNISERIQPKDAVANVPLTSDIVNSTGSHYAPEIPGDVSHIANASNGNLNINDPTSPSLFSHSFAIDDGGSFEMNVTDYECKEGHYNVTGETVEVGGETRSVARCTEFAAKNESHRGTIFVDNNPIDQLEQTTYDDWQANITKVLKSDRYPETTIDPDGRLNTTSNQALVVYDLPPEGPPHPTRNTMALLVRVGLAESDAQGTGIVTVRVSEAEVG